VALTAARPRAAAAADGAAPGPILIGLAEALAAPEAAWSLLGAGLSVAGFTRRGSRPALRRQHGIRLREITAPEDDAEAALEELRAAVQAFQPLALMPLDDASVWLCDRAAAELGVPVVGATGEQAVLALDKLRQLELAAAAGLPVPATRVCRTREDALAVEEFPAILKPALALAERRGRLVRGVARVCADRGELEAAVDAWSDGGPLLVQPWLRGAGEGLFGFAGDDGVRHWSAHRRLRMVNPQGSGSSACVSAPPDLDLVRAATRMIEAAGWRGLFMLEFLREPGGAAWFMELNGRTWGSLALARRLGLEYPAWAALEALGVARAPATPPGGRGGEPVVCRHLGREIVHVLSVLRGPRSAALDDWPSRWGTVRDVARIRRGERWYNWSARHPGVFVDDTVRTVLRAVSPR
jgi:predicted ATP-grasp superfamily ATP-dependent carboligase